MQSNNMLQPKEQQLKQFNLITYGLYFASYVVGITWLVAIIMNYVKREEVRGTWLESHVEWQIKTFWISILGYVIGFITMFFLIGFVIILITFIWNMYRLIIGLIALTENRPIER